MLLIQFKIRTVTYFPICNSMCQFIKSLCGTWDCIYTPYACFLQYCSQDELCLKICRLFFFVLDGLALIYHQNYFGYMIKPNVISFFMHVLECIS